ncbi:MAG: thioredoxin domain-containing protein [Bacteroidetes bacterium]|nr:thioredoxin domain-containing protein [Bacteroidota bacterium]
MPNHLIHEQSPYLLQHAHNPVDWYPWGDEAFAKAKQENKPVLVSIGYAACHWCHVMERESFEDAPTAAYMNENFVCVKVDREEHPDVDAFFMDAVQAISGSGGWPLNAFATAEKIPFYGGTYFPRQAAYNRPSWRQVLQRIREIWDTQKDEVVAQAAQMMTYLSKATEGATGKSSEPTKEGCFAMARALLDAADHEWGGFGAAPKFSGTLALRFMIEHYFYFGNEQALKHALLSLDKMISGGIYDQIGGGFSRYSTDRQWLVPHFEKMLYDNALMISVLCDAYRITRKQRYREVIEETIAFVNRELRCEEGGFFCALDADSEGVEGKFYTWTWDEIMKVIGGRNPFVEAYFGLKAEGNWEGVNILHEALPLVEAARLFGVPAKEASIQLAEWKQKLFQIRDARIHPQTDDKSLLSWNAMMNSALTKAGQLLENNDWISQAEQHMDWMIQAFREPGGTWNRVWKSGHSRIQAKLEDYTFLAEAMLAFGLATCKYQWVEEAASMCEQILKNFEEKQAPYLYSVSSVQPELPLRKVELVDGVTASANATIAGLLQVLGILFGRIDWTARSEEMIGGMISVTSRYPSSFGMWAVILQRWLAVPKAVVVCGQKSEQNIAELSKKCPPHAVVLDAQKAAKKIPLTSEKNSDADSLIFVCSATACLPAESVPEDALRLL